MQVCLYPFHALSLYWLPLKIQNPYISSMGSYKFWMLPTSHTSPLPLLCSLWSIIGLLFLKHKETPISMAFNWLNLLLTLDICSTNQNLNFMGVRCVLLYILFPGPETMLSRVGLQQIFAVTDLVPLPLPKL